MIPTREEAERILAEAEPHNPGLWVNHSYYVAQCAEKIAEACDGIDAEKAYVCGLLHDIGRRFGVKHMGHIYDGWKYMLELGYDEVARICLSHSFCIQRLADYLGNFDITEEEQKELEAALDEMIFDDYDLLIQLCDSIAGGEGIMDIEARMSDVKRRYGSFPQDKWDRNLELKQMFEERCGKNIYEVVGKSL